MNLEKKEPFFIYTICLAAALLFPTIIMKQKGIRQSTHRDVAHAGYSPMINSNSCYYVFHLSGYLLYCQSYPTLNVKLQSNTNSCTSKCRPQTKGNQIWEGCLIIFHVLQLKHTVLQYYEAIVIGGKDQNNQAFCCVLLNCLIQNCNTKDAIGSAGSLV